MIDPVLTCISDLGRDEVIHLYSVLNVAGTESGVTQATHVSLQHTALGVCHDEQTCAEKIHVCHFLLDEKSRGSFLDKECPERLVEYLDSLTTTDEDGLERVQATT
jgi:hypothetical protein